jgi:hypothetical protein
VRARRRSASAHSWSWVGSGAYFLREVWWQKMWRFNAPGKRHDAIVRDKITLGSTELVFARELPS